MIIVPLSTHHLSTDQDDSCLALTPRTKQFGCVRLTISCDGNQICCSVIEAKNLIPMDQNGASDPYVVVRIMGSSSRQKTKVIESTLNPTWNEKLIIDLKPEDQHKRLLVECWDKNPLADNFMGRMSIWISANMAQDGWFKFLDEKEGELFNLQVYDKELTQQSAQDDEKQQKRKSSTVRLDIE